MFNSLPAGYGGDIPKTYWAELLTIPCVMIGLPFAWLLLMDLSAKWADFLLLLIPWLRMHLYNRYPDVPALSYGQPMNRPVSSPPMTPAPQPSVQRKFNGVNGLHGALNGTTVPQKKRSNMNGTGKTTPGPAEAILGHSSPLDVTSMVMPVPMQQVWTLEHLPPPPANKLIWPVMKESQRNATQWTSLVLLVVYPFLGSFVFGTWAELTFASSLAQPLISLMCVSPPGAYSLSWKLCFQIYVLIGWIFMVSSFLLWYSSWLSVIKRWARLLNIRIYDRSYSLQSN